MTGKLAVNKLNQNIAAEADVLNASFGALPASMSNQADKRLSTAALNQTAIRSLVSVGIDTGQDIGSQSA